MPLKKKRNPQLTCYCICRHVDHSLIDVTAVGHAVLSRQLLAFNCCFCLAPYQPENTLVAIVLTLVKPSPLQTIRPACLGGKLGGHVVLCGVGGCVRERTERERERERENTGVMRERENTGVMREREHWGDIT